MSDEKAVQDALRGTRCGEAIRVWKEQGMRCTNFTEEMLDALAQDPERRVEVAIERSFRARRVPSAYASVPWGSNELRLCTMPPFVDQAPDALDKWAAENQGCVAPVGLWWGSVSSLRMEISALQTQVRELKEAFKWSETKRDINNEGRHEQSEKIRKDMTELKTRLAAVENRPIGVVDCGTYEEGVTYPEGGGVSHDGSFWIAQRRTSAAPGGDETGASSRDWRLAVRRGKPGKSGHDRSIDARTLMHAPLPSSSGGER
jgi:hypothetical protein